MRQQRIRWRTTPTEVPCPFCATDYLRVDDDGGGICLHCKSMISDIDAARRSERNES